MSTFKLSYLGDAWYELWCRQYALAHNQHAGTVHRQVVQLVRCQTQTRLMKAFLPYLSKEEYDIFRRGKNSKHLSCPPHATMAEYRLATGFECLVGAWYLQNQSQRFEELIHQKTIHELFQEILVFDISEEKEIAL